MRQANQLEPDALISSFRTHPPLGFEAWQAACGVTVFAADFYLLTTLDDELRHKLEALPGLWWRKLITPHTCFVGTTVSEYCLLSPNLAPKKLIASLKQEFADKYAFLIIKDLPHVSPLLSLEENTRAEAMIAAARDAGFVMVEGQALAYVPINFTSIDEYLARLSSSRRRDLRRKLKTRDQITITTEHTGDAKFADDAVIDEYYSLYCAVFDQSETHFDQLSKPFFADVLRNPAAGGVIFNYHNNGQFIGFNLCFVQDGNMIDKYVGFRYPAARKLNLYFVSWFANLEWALEHKLRYYVGGWSDPEVKKALGASFTFTCHAVHVRNFLLRSLLKPLSSLFERDAHVIKPDEDADA